MSGPVGVSYATSDGTATAGTDYTTASSTLIWANAVATPQTFNILITNDTEVEANETVTITLSTATGGATITGTNPVTLTIVDNDGTTSTKGKDSGGCLPGTGTSLLPLLAAAVMFLRRRRT